MRIIYGDMPVADAALDQKIETSPLLSAIGGLIYAVGSLLEWCLGKVFELITGSSLFPWADAILFNAVPFLDANMFTASNGSLISIIYDFLTGTYYSLLTLASTFFGIAVMFSAIKLAITAIAEDKARYKKAIVDWLLGLVMLWGVHFFMSFVMYLNEQFVVIASTIVNDSLSEAGNLIIELSNTTKSNTEIVHAFVDLMENAPGTFGDALGAILAVVGAIIVSVAVAALIFFSGGTAAGLIAGIAWVGVGTGMIVAGVYRESSYLVETLIENAVLIQDVTNVVEANKLSKATDDSKNEGIVAEAKKWMFSVNDTYTYTDTNGFTTTYTYNPVDLCAGFLKDENYKRTVLAGVAESDSYWTLDRSGSLKEVMRVWCDAYQLIGDVTIGEGEDSVTMRGYDLYKLQLTAYEVLPVTERNESNYNATRHKLYKSYCDIFEQYVIKQKSETNILYNLAAYFKETSWEIRDGGWSADKAKLQNVIMYVLLVCYSLVFFISYTKRLFYIIMLTLMAPIVVVFDFFMKFGK